MEVRLETINKLFGKVHAVKDVSLVVRDHEFVTLLGPSGCGKTTLLRMIAGLESISGGDLFFGERRVNHLRPAQRNVAMVFQNYALYPNMNVAGNIGYGLRVRRIPRDRIRKRVREVADILEIGHLLDRKPRQLSGGQRQRVALGRAMVRDPSIFLMDEPLSNLDAKLRVTMRSELKRFHLDLNTTTIYVTHDQLEAMTMSDKIAVMRDGVVLQFDTPQAIFNSPVNLFVATFVGNPPMNVLDTESFEIPQPLRQEIGRLGEGRRLLLGIRPQDITLAGPGAADTIEAVVELVELLGSEKLVELATHDKRRILVQVRADASVSAGDRVGLTLDPRRTHIFDAESEARLE